jgi:hypothetical protein
LATDYRKPTTVIYAKEDSVKRTMWCLPESRDLLRKKDKKQKNRSYRSKIRTAPGTSQIGVKLLRTSRLPQHLSSMLPPVLL